VSVSERVGCRRACCHGALSEDAVCGLVGGTIGARGHFIRAKELVMTTEPKRQQPDIPPQKPDIQPEPRPEEIPQDKDIPEKESPPMQLQ
jgi:hypothetical protein